jgi:mediator of RNA polymerase II transcription subunit 18, fungi type
MMQELFLFGQIDDSRHAQLLSILSGLTAARPRPSLERHVLFKPIRAPNQDITRGVSSQAISTKPIVPSGAGNKEVFHIRLVKSLQPTEFGTTPASSEARTGWTQRFYDTPDPVQRSAGLRTVRDVGVQGDDPMEAITGAGYV